RAYGMKKIFEREMGNCVYLYILSDKYCKEGLLNQIDHVLRQKSIIFRSLRESGLSSIEWHDMWDEISDRVEADRG
ncbi:hypothetical protein, partial [Xanthomonas campestris]|uniref:hypothetical protein n=1 Tax=Xanthomonas campestris TaxID=339 RepID=UPI00403A0ADA